MIFLVVLLLLAILVALLTDWKRVLKWWNRVRPSRSAAATTVLNQPSFEAVTPLAVVEEPVDHQVSPEVAELLEQADIHFRKGEVKAAENAYLKAAAADPHCAKAYSRLGVIYLEHGDNWSDAEEAFRQALKVEPHNGFVLNNLGLVLYHQDKYADAIRQFEQAVRQDELNAARHANLGMAYMAMRQYAKAESSFKKALKLAPNELEYKDLLVEAIEKKQAHKTMIRR